MTQTNLFKKFKDIYSSWVVTTIEERVLSEMSEVLLYQLEVVQSKILI